MLPCTGVASAAAEELGEEGGKAGAGGPRATAARVKKLMQVAEGLPRYVAAWQAAADSEEAALQQVPVAERRAQDAEAEAAARLRQARSARAAAARQLDEAAATAAARRRAEAPLATTDLEWALERLSWVLEPGRSA